MISDILITLFVALVLASEAASWWHDILNPRDPVVLAYPKTHLVTAILLTILTLITVPILAITP